LFLSSSFPLCFLLGKLHSSPLLRGLKNPCSCEKCFRFLQHFSTLLKLLQFGHLTKPPADWDSLAPEAFLYTRKNFKYLNMGISQSFKVKLEVSGLDPTCNEKAKNSFSHTQRRREALYGQTFE